MLLRDAIWNRSPDGWDGPWIEDLWRHVRTGQVRIYSDDDWEGRRVSFNGGPEMVMRARGRHGRLYLSVDPREGV